MADIFVSYARGDEARAAEVAEALRSVGYGVWRDDELPAHRGYAEVIEERLKSAKAVVVLWSAEAAKSQWVRAEADAARGAGTLVQATLDGTVPPLPFNQIQCADLKAWRTSAATAGWRKLQASVEALAGAGQDAPPDRQPRRCDLSICVLPFANMSGDAEQEYFSDGISEDISTDLSKVSALAVTARNTAFTFKGTAVDVPTIAKKLGVTHVLEGSVRKAGNRVRITAQLIDGATGDHVWAERFDRDLTDIFTIQDEISKAIVEALKVKLLPQEKKAIEQRGTTSADAYDLYLMARQYWISGNDGDPRRDEIILRLCQSAIDVDANYARAWALMALTQSGMHFRNRCLSENGVAAADRAIELDRTLAEPHCVKARHFALSRQFDEANAEVETALRLDPTSWEVIKEVAYVTFRQGDIATALRYFREAAELMESDYRSPGMMVTCGRKLGDAETSLEGARMAVERAEKVLREDRSNGAALAYGVVGLAELGEATRAREWMRKALLVDPNNLVMRYNLACASVMSLKDHDAALQLLEPYIANATRSQLEHVHVDPDFDPLRQDARFQAMISAATERLEMAEEAARASPAAASSARPRS